MKFNKVLSIVLAILTHCSYPCCASNGIGKLDGKFGMESNKGNVGRRPHVFNGRNTEKIGLGVKKQLDNSSVNVKNLALGLFCVGVPLSISIGLIVADIKGSGNSVPFISADQLCHTGNGAKFVKGEYICGGVQGSVYRCTFNGDDNYVLKEIDFNKIGHNPVVSEVLAYNKLKDLQCEHIVKPVHYVQEAEKKARFIYKFANGEKIDDDSLKKKIRNLNDLSRRRLLVSIVDQLLRVVDLLHNEYGIAHGDMNHENYLIHIDEKNEASVRVIDFGYCYELKDKYVESDVKEMCHPVTSVIHFVNGIYKLIVNFIDKNEANKFCKYVLDGVSDNMCNLVKSVLLLGSWPTFGWRMNQINKILKVDIKECNIVIQHVREYINKIK